MIGLLFHQTMGYPSVNLRGSRVQYKVDGIPIENLGHATKDPIRADNVRQQWYWRLPTVIFKPGELYDILNQPEDYLHSFEYSLNGNVIFTGYFYLRT